MDQFAEVMDNTAKPQIDCLIIDDEFFAQEIIREYIGKVEWLNLVGVADNAMQALDKIRTLKPRLVFLDIYMPEITGIELLKALTSNNQQTNTIITSANSAHAFDAFELNVIDYLLKPISFDRFLKAVLKAQKLLETDRIPPDQAENIRGGRAAQKYNYADTTVSPSESTGKLWIKADKKMYHLDVNKLMAVESLKDYVQFRNTDGSKVIAYQTLQQIESLLPDSEFLRVHRSFIINIGQIKYIYGNMIVMNTDEEFPVGVSFRDAVMTKLNILENRKAK